MKAALALMVASVLTAPCLAQVTLPTTGVDVEDYITAAITALGTVVAVAVGGYFAFLIIRKALGWGRKMA
jgi:hypothetical protein